jgi:hypothetical protein
MDVGAIFPQRSGMKIITDLGSKAHQVSWLQQQYYFLKHLQKYTWYQSIEFTHAGNMS